MQVEKRESDEEAEELVKKRSRGVALEQPEQLVTAASRQEPLQRERKKPRNELVFASIPVRRQEVKLRIQFSGVENAE